MSVRMSFVVDPDIHPDTQCKHKRAYGHTHIYICIYIYKHKHNWYIYDQPYSPYSPICEHAYLLVREHVSVRACMLACVHVSNDIVCGQSLLKHKDLLQTAPMLCFYECLRACEWSPVLCVDLCQIEIQRSVHVYVGDS